MAILILSQCLDARRLKANRQRTAGGEVAVGVEGGQSLVRDNRAAQSAHAAVCISSGIDSLRMTIIAFSTRP